MGIISSYLLKKHIYDLCIHSHVFCFNPTINFFFFGSVMHWHIFNQMCMAVHKLFQPPETTKYNNRSPAEDMDTKYNHCVLP